MAFQPETVVLADRVIGGGGIPDRRGLAPVTLSAEPLDVYTPSEMAGYLSGYRNAEFRADEASKVVPVDKEVDKYRTFGRADTFQPAMVKVNHEDKPKEINWRSSLEDYRLQWKAIATFINDITTDQQGPNVNAYEAGMDRCMTVMHLQREIEVWDLLTDPTNWNSNYVIALTGSTKWNGGASKDILGNLQRVLEASDMRITDWWLNQRVANLMLKDDAIRNQMRQWYGDNAPPAVNVNDAASTTIDFAIPGLGRFHVVSGKVRDENDVDGVLPFILGDDVVATVSPPGVPTHGERTSTSYTFRLKSAQGSGGFSSRVYRVEDRGPKGGRMLVVYACDAPIFTGPTVGGLITGIIQ